jgi:hypothetical protein
MLGRNAHWQRNLWRVSHFDREGAWQLQSISSATTVDGELEIKGKRPGAGELLAFSGQGNLANDKIEALQDVTDHARLTELPGLQRPAEGVETRRGGIENAFNEASALCVPGQTLALAYLDRTASNSSMTCTGTTRAMRFCSRFAKRIADVISGATFVGRVGGDVPVVKPSSTPRCRWPRWFAIKVLCAA